jgi:hypothetical protein
MLWTLFAILLILWLLGWGFHIAGALIHVLLVIAILCSSPTSSAVRPIVADCLSG